VPWTRYVAIGDSFTEGLWDCEAPDGVAPAMEADTPVRGWADRLAAALSARRVAQGQAPIEYANLAIRGRLLGPIVRDQVPAAIGLQPDLVSLAGGGNDILRVTTDVDGLLRLMDGAVARVRASGADVLIANGTDPHGPLIGLTRGRCMRYYAGLWTIARRHGAYLLDEFGMASLPDSRLWAHDRIHLTPEGHRRVANAALVALGLGPDDPRYDVPLGGPGPGFVERRKADAAWVKADVWPWVQRHLRGRSSGDGRSPKRPLPRPMPPAPATL
jgi:lysophospholipase L1-like esterase